MNKKSEHLKPRGSARYNYCVLVHKLTQMVPNSMTKLSMNSTRIARHLCQQISTKFATDTKNGNIKPHLLKAHCHMTNKPSAKLLQHYQLKNEIAINN